MNKREAKCNTILEQYLREKRKEKWYIYYELKYTNTESFQFSKIEKGQEEGLPVVEKHGFVYKFSDEISRTMPMDGMSSPPLPTYLIIVFKDEFCFVPQKEITKLKKAGKVSISRSKAEELSDKILKYKL